MNGFLRKWFPTLEKLLAENPPRPSAKVSIERMSETVDSMNERLKAALGHKPEEPKKPAKKPSRFRVISNDGPPN